MPGRSQEGGALLSRSRESLHVGAERGIGDEGGRGRGEMRVTALGIERGVMVERWGNGQ